MWSAIDGCILTILGFLVLSILFSEWCRYMDERDRKRGLK